MTYMVGIKGWEDLYQVTQDGKVFSLKTNKFLSITYTPYGSVTLARDGSKTLGRVHKLVAEAFCVKTLGCSVVNHKDGNKRNNHHTNLEWVTHKQNSQHAATMGLYPNLEGAANPAAKLTDSQIRDIYHRVVHLKEKQKDVASLYGIRQGYVSRIATGKIWNSITKESKID